MYASCVSELTEYLLFVLNFEHDQMLYWTYDLYTMGTKHG